MPSVLLYLQTKRKRTQILSQKITFAGSTHYRKDILVLKETF
jgi:hypothetical protein